ncbi:hypothetical protein BGZ88_007730 [Linnemannia elongata]|nr:hypothetical protein BGZ88_007730 [Linnemannia elongata]
MLHSSVDSSINTFLIYYGDDSRSTQKKMMLNVDHLKNHAEWVQIIGYGPLPSSALAISNGRLFPSLKSLHLTGCCKVTSRMALDALLQYHELEDFRVPRISVTDLKLTPQPWVCHGLKRLSVFFASDPVDPRADSLVFEQLSRLQWLESLDVSQQHE